MATDAEMRNAGVHLPGGSDYITDGDDAITANARVLWDRIEGARFDQTAVPLGASDVFDNLPTNIYTWWSGDVAEALEMPFLAQGTMIMSRWGSAGGVALAMSRSLDPQLYINSRLSGGWVGWTEVGGAADPVQQLKPAGAAGLKTAPLAMTTGYGGARTSGSGTTSVIQYLPKAASRLQLHMRNWNPRYINSDRAAVSLSGVRIGRHTSNGNGTDWVNLPGGSTAYTSGWIIVPEALRGGEVVVQYTWSGSDVTQCLGTAWTNGSRTDAPPMFVWLALEVPSTTPVVAAFGSSTAAGVGASRPLIDSWLAQWARTHDAVPAFWAHSGDSASSWTDTANRKWELYGDTINAPDAMLYAMGSNDWAAGTSLEELQQRIASTSVELRRRVGGALYGTTITPRLSPPANDSTRLELNEWMGTSGLFQGVFDLAGAVALPDGTLDPAISADGTHVTTAGHARLAAAINLPIVTPPNSDPRTTGVRNFNTLMHAEDQGWINPVQTCRATRIGNTVSIVVTGLQRAEAGDGYSTVMTVPAGFRPAVDHYFTTWRAVRSRVLANGTLELSYPSTPLDYFTITYVTDSPFPVEPYPGSPA